MQGPVNSLSDYKYKIMQQHFFFSTRALQIIGRSLWLVPFQTNSDSNNLTAVGRVLIDTGELVGIVSYYVK